MGDGNFRPRVCIHHADGCAELPGQCLDDGSSETGPRAWRGRHTDTVVAYGKVPVLSLGTVINQYLATAIVREGVLESIDDQFGHDQPEANRCVGSGDAAIDAHLQN